MPTKTQRPSRIAPHGQIGFGTGSRRRSAVRLSTWHWINRAVRFTDEAEYFFSEASVYRLLKAHDLITSPAYIVKKSTSFILSAPRGALQSGAKFDAG
jgi:hypothetical protein